MLLCWFLSERYSLATHNLCALHLSWWFTISNRKLLLPSANDVLISGISLLHFRQNLQYIMFRRSSYCNHTYESSQFGLKREPLRPTGFCWLDVAIFEAPEGDCITEHSLPPISGGTGSGARGYKLGSDWRLVEDDISDASSPGLVGASRYWRNIEWRCGGAVTKGVNERHSISCCWGVRDGAGGCFSQEIEGERKEVCGQRKGRICVNSLATRGIIKV